MTTSSENTLATNKWRVLFDANVVLDVLARRSPYLRDSAAVWGLVETERIEGFVSAHSCTTLHYLISRQLKRHEADMALRKLLGVFKIATVNQEVIVAALGYGWPDFEDAVQMAAAEFSSCDYVVTRDLTGFRTPVVNVISPVELLAISGT